MGDETGDSFDVGLVPVPSDEQLEIFIGKMIWKDKEYLAKKMQQLEDAVVETREEDQPKAFAYAKLTNFLARGIDMPELIHLCAAAMWSLR